MNRKLTPEQEERQQILFDMHKALGLDRNKIPSLINEGTILWLHFTDWNQFFDLERLEREGILKFVPSLVYVPEGNWRDYFPPSAYKFTRKAKFIYHNPSLWVFEGVLEEKK